MASLEEEWENFMNDENDSNDDEPQTESRNDIVPDGFVPHCTDIKISTKTKILYLSHPLDLHKLFWNTKITPYDKHECGVIKKQIKFNFNTKNEVNDFEEKIKHETNANVCILNQIDNPNGRVKFKDVRKVNIGYSKSDVYKNKKSSKSAFYNCLVLIYRTFYEGKYKELHIKLFNSGKLEVPGIQSDDIIDHIIDIMKGIIDRITGLDIQEIKEKRETVLVNSNFSCNYYINRQSLFDILKHKYNIKCNYDSCSYPGIQCKYKHNTDEISFMIFRTGSVLIVGKCEDDVLFEIYNFLKTLFLSEYKSIYETNEHEIKKPKPPKVKKSIVLTRKITS